MSSPSSVSGGSAPPQAPRTEGPPPGRRGEPARDPRSEAFHAALHEVDRQDADEADETRGGDEARPGARKRKAAEGGGLASLLGAKGAPHGLDALSTLRGRKEEPGGALAGLDAYTGGAGSAAAGAAEAQGASPADLSAFTQMMEAAAVRAQAAQEGAPVTVSLNDAGALLQGFQVVRSADGALSFTLQAAPGAAEEVSRSLDTLRRRLEARGLSLGELKLAEGDGPAPRAVQAADPG